MRHPPRTPIAITSAAVLSLVGCTMDGQFVFPHIRPKPQPTSAEASPQTQQVQQVNAEAQQQTNRLQQAMERSAMPAAGLPQVHWIDPAYQQTHSSSPRIMTPAKPKPTAVAWKTTSPAPEPMPVIESEPASAPVAAPKKQAAPNREQLLDLLRDHIRRSDDPAMSKALTSAALSLADPNHTLDPALLSPLDRKQRDTVQRYHRLIVSLGRQLAESSDEINSDQLINELDQMFGQPTIRIRNVKLCKRVRGFGVYETLDQNTFLRGREHRMIVYVELDDFQSVQSENDQYEVKLTQQVSLFSETDGLEVWRQPAVDIVDKSHNQRRDFFVVQLIELPGQLNVGKYRLKVRVIDRHHDDCIDETVVPIRIVADEALTSAQAK